MKLSVIVPVYNRERYVGAALRSLLRQRDAVDLDILVVDDGSTDGTVDIVRELMSDAANIRVFRQDNQGVAKARNAALDLLPEDGELITFLDSDDISPAGRFAGEIPYFEADPSLNLTYSLICKLDQIDDAQLEPAAGAQCEIIRGIQLGAAIYRRCLIDAVGRFDEDFAQAEDTDFLFRTFEQNPARLLLDRIGVFYRQHPAGLMANADVVRREFMRALLKSKKRRKKDPTLGRANELFLQPEALPQGKILWDTYRLPAQLETPRCLTAS